jgi:hypothetical protein
MGKYSKSRQQVAVTPGLWSLTKNKSLWKMAEFLSKLNLSELYKHPVIFEVND